MTNVIHILDETLCEQMFYSILEFLFDILLIFKITWTFKIGTIEKNILLLKILHVELMIGQNYCSRKFLDNLY